MFTFLPLQRLAQRDLTRYVNPFIGTAGHGHTFPGAIVPFGMVQLSPDTRLTGWDGCSGYHYSDSKIWLQPHTSQRHRHLRLRRHPVDADSRLNTFTSGRFQHRNETATPGYYSVKLDDENIFVELTTTARVGMHRYTFPSTDRQQTSSSILHIATKSSIGSSHHERTHDRWLETITGLGQRSDRLFCA